MVSLLIANERINWTRTSEKNFGSSLIALCWYEENGASSVSSAEDRDFRTVKNQSYEEALEEQQRSLKTVKGPLIMYGQRKNFGDVSLDYVRM